MVLVRRYSPRSSLRGVVADEGRCRLNVVTRCNVGRCIAVDVGDSELPSLADTIAAVRRGLIRRRQPVELVTRTGGGRQARGCGCLPRSQRVLMA